jgi:FMN hydrolase / 5-amino-6-(5-phospho-D-ribitylamino)uracil phosphatase
VIEAVLFDGDQTLWDFQKVMRTALLDVLDAIRAARPGAAADALRIADLQADRGAVAEELLGVEFNLARLRRLGFTRTLGRLRRDGAPGTESDDEALADALTATYFRSRDRDPALFADTLPVLEALRSEYRVGLLSNGSRLPESIGLGGIFEVVVFAQDHRVTKPDRGIFEVVEQQMQLAPSACVLVGDHPLNDVAGAKRSGWRAIWIDRQGDGSWPDQAFDETPDAMITSLEQLPTALRRMRVVQ